MFKNYKKIFFIGIGGIGMSAVAKYFLNKDKIIYGYDILRSDICISLEKQGSKITYCQKNLDFILDNNLFKDQKSCLIVYTPAIKNDNIFLKFFTDNNFNVKKRSEILSKICEKKFLVAVAGTHGKTTTTSIISHILNSTDFNITAFIGGISRNENSNLIGGENDSKLIIVEADEYDKSFLKLSPNIAIITSVDMDHSDIYTKTSSLKKAYHQFISNIARDGVLIIENKALQELGNINFSNIITYSFSEDTDFRISSYELTNRNSRFNFINSNSKFFFTKEIVFCLPGKHNILNALASILVCIQLDVKKEDIVNKRSSKDCWNFLKYGKCKFGDKCHYKHDESKNKKGPNQCDNDCDCDGKRTCSPWKWCEGEARKPAPKPKPKPKPPSCTSKNYYHDEKGYPILELQYPEQDFKISEGNQVVNLDAPNIETVGTLTNVNFKDKSIS